MSNRGRHKKSNQHLIIQTLGIKIANRIMECQKNCGNLPNLDVFLRDPTCSKRGGGFDWRDTIEGFTFWETTLVDNFREHHLYKKYKNDWS